MICYDKYGKMTTEFQAYQQETWDKLRAISEQLSAQAIKDGVCPNAFRDTMVKAIECGSTLVCLKAYVDDLHKAPPAPNTLPIDYV